MTPKYISSTAGPPNAKGAPHQESAPHSAASPDQDRTINLPLALHPSNTALPTDQDDRELFEFVGVRCEAATSKALLCWIRGVARWVPHSQIDAESDVHAKGDTGSLVATFWWASRAGLVGASP